jgi:hypothetical protein
LIEVYYRLSDARSPNLRSVYENFSSLIFLVNIGVFLEKKGFLIKFDQRYLTSGNSNLVLVFILLLFPLLKERVIGSVNI